MGTGVLAADQDTRSARARAGLFGTVLVFVVAVKEVGVAGLPVGRMDRHPFGARLFQVEYTLRCIPHTFSSPVVFAFRTSVAGPVTGVNGARTISIPYNPSQ
jgi:hypothetical protein